MQYIWCLIPVVMVVCLFSRCSITADHFCAILRRAAPWAAIPNLLEDREQEPLVRCGPISACAPTNLPKKRFLCAVGPCSGVYCFRLPAHVEQRELVHNIENQVACT